MLATVNNMTFDVSNQTARLIAADAVQEMCGPKDEWRAQLMRDLSAVNWPDVVDESDRFTQAVLWRVRSAFDKAVSRWVRQDVPVSIAELTPGVVGIRARDLTAVVCTRDVGRTLADYAANRIRERVSLVIANYGHEQAERGGWQFPDEPEVAADLAAVTATTGGTK
jgi:hypothetical protein